MIMSETKLFVFDLDDTLAPSKQPMPKELAHELVVLSQKYEIAILTGGQYKQIVKQVFNQLPLTVAARLHGFGCSGSQYKTANGMLTSDMIPAATRAHLKNLVEKVAIEFGYWCENPVGDIIEDRLSQVTFSALGQEASPGAKSGWDVDKAKRQRMVDRLRPLAPEYEFRIGGSTSIDVTPIGRDKAYGMSRVLNLVGVEPYETVYVGDSFSNSGNDFPVLSTGVFCLEVSGWEQTLNLVRWFNRG
jgi:hypothetical protein